MTTISRNSSMVRQSLGIGLALLALLSVAGVGMADETVVNATHQQPVQPSAPAARPATPAAPGNSQVIPAGHIMMDEFRVAIDDPRQDLSLRNHLPRGRLLGRPWIVTQTVKDIHRSHQEDHQSIIGWFCYIKGHGPSVWVHNE